MQMLPTVVKAVRHGAQNDYIIVMKYFIIIPLFVIIIIIHTYFG